jgi:heme exporter protein A
VPDDQRQTGGAGELAASGELGAAPTEIAVEGLRKTFGRREVLKGLSFSLERGGFLSIFGPNGAGKTTTLRVLATLLTPSAGSVRVAGHDVREDPMPVRKAIGFISHNPMLYPDLTAQENLRFYADMYGVADREERIAELLERLELSHRRYDVVRTFSKGMRQRLAIARAILHRPRVLLLDEPHSGLDPRAVDILDGLLADIRAEHTFVMVTHNLAKGLELGTRLMIVENGRIAYEHAAGVDPEAFGAVYREHVREGAVA